MTKKERPLPSQPDHIENVRSTPEDEITLTDLLEALNRKKVFIVAVTLICTLFSAFYAQQITPIYTTSITFLPNHIESSTSHILNFYKFEISRYKPAYVFPLFKRPPVLLDSGKKFIDIKSDVETGKAVLGAINKSIQISNSGDGKKWK